MDKQLKAAIKYYDNFSNVYDWFSPKWYYHEAKVYAIEQLALKSGDTVLNLPCTFGTKMVISKLLHYALSIIFFQAQIIFGQIGIEFDSLTTQVIELDDIVAHNFFSNDIPQQKHLDGQSQSSKNQIPN